MLFESGEVWQLVCTTTNFANWSSESSPDQIFPKKVKKQVDLKSEGKPRKASSTSLYYISLSLGFGNMIDIDIQISISEGSSGWATN